MTARLTKERIAEMKKHERAADSLCPECDMDVGGPPGSSCICDGIQLAQHRILDFDFGELLASYEALAAEADRYREALEEIERELLPFAKSNAAGMSVLAALGACSSALTADTKEGK